MKPKLILALVLAIIVCITFALPSTADTISVTINCQSPINPAIKQSA
jgi:hypothetical protein